MVDQNLQAIIDAYNAPKTTAPAPADTTDYYANAQKANDMNLPASSTNINSGSATPVLPSPITPVSSDFSKASGGSSPAYKADGTNNFSQPSPVTETTGSSLQDTYSGSGASNDSYYQDPHQDSNANLPSNYMTLTAPEDYLKNISAYGTSSDANANADRTAFQNGQNENAQANKDYANGASNQYAQYLQDFNTKQTLQNLQDNNSQLANLKAQYENLQGRANAGGAFGSVINANVARNQNLLGTQMTGLKSLSDAYSGNLASALDYATKATNGIWSPKLTGIQNAINFANQNQGLFNSDQNASLAKNTTAYTALGEQYKSARDDQLKARELMTNMIQNGAGNDPVARLELSRLAQNPNLSTKDILGSTGLGKYMRPQGYLSYDAGTMSTVNTATGEMNGVTGGTSGATGTGSTVSGYDLSKYATDPAYTAKIKSIVDSFGGEGSITNVNGIMQSLLSKGQYGAKTAEIAQGIMDASKKYGIDPTLLTAQVLQETGGKMSPVAIANNNLGGVTASSTNGLAKGTARPSNEGGNYAKFDSIAQGIDKQAQVLSGMKAKAPATQNNMVSSYSVDPSTPEGKNLLRQNGIGLTSPEFVNYKNAYNFVSGSNGLINPSSTAYQKNNGMINTFNVLHDLKTIMASVKQGQPISSNTAGLQAFERLKSQVGIQTLDPSLSSAQLLQTMAGADIGQSLFGPSSGSAEERNTISTFLGADNNNLNSFNKNLKTALSYYSDKIKQQTSLAGADQNGKIPKLKALNLIFQNNPETYKKFIELSK